MRNTGILLFLIGLYLVINSGSIRDLFLGKATIGFVNPKTSGSSGTGGSNRNQGNIPS